MSLTSQFQRIVSSKAFILCRVDFEGPFNAFYTVHTVCVLLTGRTVFTALFTSSSFSLWWIVISLAIILHLLIFRFCINRIDFLSGLLSFDCDRFTSKFHNFRSMDHLFDKYKTSYGTLTIVCQISTNISNQQV